MKTVITYGTYDLLHFGHIRLLERAKALGDYLIVGVTADDFDMTRGKINVQQSLMERIEAVRATGIADKIIVEEYEGQKIDDILRYNVDIFTVGSDWEGKFDYLSEYCKVHYLERTEGISSSEIRAERQDVRIGIVGESDIINKFYNESKYVNGVRVVGACTADDSRFDKELRELPLVTADYGKLLDEVDAVYIISTPKYHYSQIKAALSRGKHVLVESPIAPDEQQCKELLALAEEKGCVLSEAIKTAYSTAYSRMMLLAKSGIIGDIVSIDATCTSLRQMDGNSDVEWNSVEAWGPTAVLPIFHMLGTGYSSRQIVVRYADKDNRYDDFTKISFVYPHAVASIKVGHGVKSEGELVVAGTKGYIYVPAPWWKNDYFEVRFEDPSNNKRYFYQLDGEGIRYEIVAFVNQITKKRTSYYINKDISLAIAGIMQAWENEDSVIKI